MTYVPPQLDIVKYLKSLTSTVLDSFVDTDTNLGRLIFRDAVPLTITGSGKRALMVTSSPGSNYPTHDLGSMVTIRFYSDHTRTSEGVASTEDGTDRAWGMFGIVDQILHAAKPLTGGIQFMQSNRASQPMEFFDRDQNVPYLAVNYDVCLHMEK